jgi:hypothetical protein
MNDASSPLAIALNYLQRGWSPVPIPYRSKNPGFKDWQNLRLTTETVAQYFDGERQNIGVLLGDASGHLLDVDLDTPEAIAVAPYLLPPTAAIFGRKSAPDAHWLYIVSDGSRRTKAYNNPELEDDDKARIVELRGTGAQTIFPGSTHQGTGEPIEWSEDGEPASITYGALERAVARVAVAALLAEWWAQGTRDDLCTATVGVLLRAGLDDESIETMLRAIAEAADDEKIEERIEKIARLRGQLHVDGAVPGYPKLEELTGKKTATSIRKWLGATQDRKSKQQSPPVESQLLIECAADIETRPVEWLVPGVFAIGKTSMIAGDPGVAKSTITLNLAASVTREPAFPWEGCKQGAVLILSAEDDPEDTIVPRLKAAGAVCSRVHIVRSVFSIAEDDRPHRRTFNLKNDLELLEATLGKYSDVVLIVIDPISAYMGGIDSHTNTSVREVLAPIAEFAARTKRAVIVVSHLNKGSGSGNTLSAMYRVMGSIGFVAAVRSVVLVVKDPDDEEGKRRLFLSVKNNNAPEPEGALAYHVASVDELPVIAWSRDRVHINAQDALNPAKTDRDAEIDAWLGEQLKAGPKPSKDIEATAKTLRFSHNRLWASKRRLGIAATRVQPPKESTDEAYWTWELPVKGDGSEM